MSAYPYFRVVRMERRTRRELETVASGLTMDEAAAMQRRLLAENEDEARITFGVRTCGLNRMAEINRIAARMDAAA